MPSNLTRADALYDPELVPLKVKELARMGADFEIIARAFNVDVSVVESWMNKYPEVSQAWKDGRLPVDVLVEDALLQNALKQEVVEETEFVENHPINGVTTRKIKKTKTSGGDVSAQKYWLSNRKKAEWGKVEQSGGNLSVIIAEGDKDL